MDITEFGKGAVPTPPEISGSQYKLSATPPPVIDWSNPYMVEDQFLIPQKNQFSASDCTCESTNYYTQTLQHIENTKDEIHSERFSYSQVFLPDGGAYIWKAMSIPLKQGVASIDSVPNGDHSETTMRDASLNPNAVIEARADKYAQITNNKNMDILAQIIKDYHGFITGFNGSNMMFLPDGTATVPPIIEWGHAVWVCGYEMRNGVKCLKFKNSWGSQWGTNGYGYFPEQFVKSGLMFDAYVYADIADLDPTSMSNRFVQVRNSDGTIKEDVWLIRNGQRSKISNAMAFQMISGEWQKIEKITQEQLDLVPDSGNELLGWTQK